MSTLLERITINPRQCGGRPCIRGMRIRVSDVLDLFAAGLTAEEILEEMPDLEADDLKASLLYASRKLNHPVEDLLLPGISVVNSLEEFQQPIQSNLTNKNVGIIVDTQILSYRFKNGEKDIYSQGFAISSITASEFLEVQSKDSEKPNYYVIHPAKYHGEIFYCSDRDNFKNPKLASRGHHRTDQIIIDFGNQFSAYREFGNEAISEIINKNKSEIYKLSIAHLPKQKQKDLPNQKNLLKRLKYILDNGYYCYSLTQSSIEQALSLFSVFTSQYNCKTNIRNTINDILILATAIDRGKKLLTRDKLLNRFTAEYYEAPMYQDKDGLLIDFSEKVVEERKHRESKEYTHRGWSYAIRNDRLV